MATTKQLELGLMAPGDAQAEQEARQAGEALGKVRSDGGLALLKQALQVAGRVEDDPTDSMLTYVQSVAPEDWEQMWAKLPNLRDNVGRKFRLFDFRIAPSDLEGNELGVFLIGDITWLDSGERALLSIGSTMCTAQAVTLKRTGTLPADLEIVQKPTKTRAGFQPIHFRYLGKAITEAAATE